MDGSAATSLAERTRSQIARSFANCSANKANAQSELFEQLLNIKFTVQPPPEKQSTAPDPTAVKSASTDVEKKDTAKTDKDKDDEPIAAVAPLSQTVPLVADKPLDLKSDQPVVETQAHAETPNATNLGATKISDQFAAMATDALPNNQPSVNVDDQVVVADTPVTDTNVDIGSKVTASNDVEPTTALRNPSEESASKKAVAVEAKPNDASSAQLQETTTTKEKAPSESPTANAQSELVAQPKQTNTQDEDRDDRRGDRHEKWFEHKDADTNATTFERPNDLSDVETAQQTPDATNPQSSQSPQLTPAASTTAAPTTDPTIASPVVLPVAMSIVPQTTPISTPTPTASSSANPESTSSVTSTPSRPVGSQPAKPNAKERLSEPGLSQQERVRVIQRIARSFNRISAEGGSINLRLHPEHLGSVSVQVRLEGRSLSARLSTETTAARDAIMQDLPALRQRLADQGFDVTKFQVDVAGNGADASFAQSNGQSQFGQSDNRSSGTQTDYRRVAATRESRAATARQLAPATNIHWQSNSGIDLQA